MTRRPAVPLILLALGLAGCAARGGTPAAPPSGRDVLARMRRAYEGAWYTQLAFVQATTFFRENGARDTVTWFESLRGADQLRIDFRSPSEGRGVVYTADSMFAFRDHARIRATGDGNPFLPVIQGVYLQPVDVTVRQLAGHHIDAAQTYGTAWDGRPVWVVGAAAAEDTTSGQFWVDTERLVAVRMLVAAAPGQPLLDVRLKDYVRTGRGWLATTIEIMQGGQLRQLEEYTEWNSAIVLPAALFNRQRLIVEGHWALQPRTGPGWERRAAN